MVSTSRLRLALLAVVLIAAWQWGGALTEGVDIGSVRRSLEAAGPLGVLGFVAAFAVGNLLSVPGLVFVIAALLAYGKLVALFGSVVALSVNFWVVRGIGGRSVAEHPGRLARWAFQHLDARPVGTVALLRTFTVLAPPVNYALALSPVRFRDYRVGSTLGLLAPLGAYALGVDCLVAAGWV